MVDHGAQGGHPGQGLGDVRQVAREDEDVEGEPALRHAPQVVEDARPQDEAVVVVILQHRAQAHEERVLAIMRQPLREGVGLHVEPADDPGDVLGPGGDLEQEIGLGLGLCRLDQDRAGDAGPAHKRREVVRHEVAQEGETCSPIQP